MNAITLYYMNEISNRMWYGNFIHTNLIYDMARKFDTGKPTTQIILPVLRISL